MYRYRGVSKPRDWVLKSDCRTHTSVVSLPTVLTLAGSDHSGGVGI